MIIFKRHLNHCLLLFLLSAIVSCNDNDYENIISDAQNAKKALSSDGKSRYFDGQLEPDFPDEDENEKTLEGVDSNNNKIRDDVEIWINYVGRNYNHRESLRQLALSVQKFYNLSKDDDKRVAVEYWDSYKCARNLELKRYEISNSPRNLVEKIVFNNPTRESWKKKFFGYTRILSHSRQYKPEEFYKICNFKLEEPEKEVELFLKSL